MRQELTGMQSCSRSCRIGRRVAVSVPSRGCCSCGRCCRRGCRIWRRPGGHHLRGVSCRRRRSRRRRHPSCGQGTEEVSDRKRRPGMLCGRLGVGCGVVCHCRCLCCGSMGGGHLSGRRASCCGGIREIRRCSQRRLGRLVRRALRRQRTRPLQGGRQRGGRHGCCGQRRVVKEARG